MCKWEVGLVFVLVLQLFKCVGNVVVLLTMHER